MWMSSIQAVASFVRANRVDFIEISTGESNICVFKKLGDDTRDWTDFHEFSVAYSKGNGTAKKSLGRGEKRWASKFVKSCGKRIRDVKGFLFGCEVSPNENAYCQSQTMQTHPLIEALECLRKAEEKESSILSRAVLPMNSIPEGSILLDVGANVGHLAEKLRTLFPQAQVRAIEADPATFEQLRVNTEADSSIRIYNRAIHSHRTMLTFYSHENSLLSSLKDLDQSQTKSITMEACSLDEFVADQKIENIVLLKIDTEGNDLNVLCGASEILKSESLRYVIVEFGISDAVQRHCHINDLVRKLTSFGFGVKCFGDWGVDGPAIYGNCLFERSSDLSRANE
jgi:FkbM family methyltransferase